MRTHQPARLRRLGVVLALLGLVFASTLASISHSMAMPVMNGTALPVAKQTAAGHHMGNTAHDCQSDAGAEAPQQKPQGPCEEGCMLCKDCTMTSFLPIPSLGIDGADGYGIYQPATVQTLAGITLPSPNEPPRV
jgi:hypothetical protein